MHKILLFTQRSQSETFQNPYAYDDVDDFYTFFLYFMEENSAEMRES